jgi:hypothetical protein
MPRTFTCSRFPSVGTFKYSVDVDFYDSSSNISVLFDGHDRWQSVPFRVCDCLHDHKRAERMIAEYRRIIDLTTVEKQTNEAFRQWRQRFWELHELPIGGR